MSTASSPFSSNSSLHHLSSAPGLTENRGIDPLVDWSSHPVHQPLVVERPSSHNCCTGIETQAYGANLHPSTTLAPIPMPNSHLASNLRPPCLHDALGQISIDLTHSHPAPLPTLKPETLLETVDRLKFFLATAPGSFDLSPFDHQNPLQREERLLNRFLLPTGEYISCVLWGGLYHITGTDIVRALHFRFLAFGRPVRSVKKFEEGIFSDLRNLKSGVDATLEEPKSPFLELLFKYNCIRTQKKQKVFYWFSVPHDRLFLDALDRDLKREKLGVESTTEAIAEPALSFIYNPQKSLYEQFTQNRQLQRAKKADEALNEDISEGVKRKSADIVAGHPRRETIIVDQTAFEARSPQDIQSLARPSVPNLSLTVAPSVSLSSSSVPSEKPPPSIDTPSTIFGSLSLFEGSPSYKQRRKPGGKKEGGVGGKIKKSGSVGPHTSSLLGFHQYHPYQQTFSAPTPAPPHANNPASHHSPAISSTSNLVRFSSSPFGTAGSHVNLNEPTPGLPASTCLPFTSAHHLPTILPLVTPSISLTDTEPASQEPFGDNGGFVRSKPYVCPLYSCGRLFKRLEHLKRHVRTHSLEKPFGCIHCDKRFTRSDNLAVHLKVHDRSFNGCSTARSSESISLGAEEDEEALAMATMIDCIDSHSSSDGNEDELSDSSHGFFGPPTEIGLSQQSATEATNFPPPAHLIPASFYSDEPLWHETSSSPSIHRHPTLSLQRSGSVSNYGSSPNVHDHVLSIRRHNSAAPTFGDPTNFFRTVGPPLQHQEIFQTHDDSHFALPPSSIVATANSQALNIGANPVVLPVGHSPHFPDVPLIVFPQTHSNASHPPLSSMAGVHGHSPIPKSGGYLGL